MSSLLQRDRRAHGTDRIGKQCDLRIDASAAVILNRAVEGEIRLAGQRWILRVHDVDEQHRADADREVLAPAGSQELDELRRSFRTARRIDG